MILACALGVAVNLLLYAPAWHYDPNRDFLGLYPGAKLLGTSHMYSRIATLAVQRDAAGFVNPNRLYVRLPFYAAMLWPLTLAPFPVAFAMFQLCMVVATIGYVWLWRIPNRRIALAACCWSAPLFGSFAIGQDISLLLLIVAGTVTLLRREKLLLAGLLFSFCLIKPHLFFWFPLVVLRRKMWRFGSGFTIGVAVLIALSFAVAGPHWISDFVRAATLPDTNPRLDLMTDLNGLFRGHILPQACGWCILAAVVWRAAGRADLRWALAAALAAFIAAPHAYVADCAIVIPALLIALSYSPSRWHRALTICLLTPVPYMCVFAGWAAVPILLLMFFAAGFVFAERTNSTTAIVGSETPVHERSIFGSGREVHRVA
jgi:hypothetical protein